ncbi:MAG: TauD/TfdA family dioxygenase [Novosphingobium sp.]
MTGKLDVRPLGGGLDFGARIGGVTRENLGDAAVRAELNRVFEESGLIVFEDVEPSAAMHAELSNVFGPMKDHPSKAVPRVDQDAMPGVIDMNCKPFEEGAIRIEGRTVLSWLPWHFDHAYNNELNRAGVLRAIDIPPEGGLTGFADGVALYRLLAPELRAKIEGRNVLYRMNVIMENLRFGRPADYAVLGERPSSDKVMEAALGTPRAVHPAVWERADGRKVLHVSPWMAEGIEGAENPEGDALLDAVAREIFALAKTHSYFHAWKLSDMIIWDNWRVLHSVSGHDPKYSRRMQRTTIKGDYGLGYFEGGGTGSKVLEMTF